MVEEWPTAKIKELDFPSPVGFMKVGDFLPHVILEVKEDYTGQYAILWESLLTNGQTKPLRISRNKTRLLDGIHRLALCELWPVMLVSTERYENDWDESPEGRRYWWLWNKRLEGFGY